MTLTMEPTNSTEVLCLHATGSSGKQWQALREHLEPNYQVHTPDLLAYGDNTFFAKPWAHALKDEAAPLIKWLDSREQPVILVGHSFGAALAMHIALRRPNKVRALSVYEPVLIHLAFHHQELAVQLLAPQRVYIDMCRDMAAERKSLAAQHFVDFWSGPGSWTQMHPNLQQHILLRLNKVLRDFEALISESTKPQEYQTLNMPVQYLLGTHSPELSATIAAAVTPHINNLEFKTINKAGHMAPAVQPQLVNAEIVRFIQQQQKQCRAA